MTQDDDGRPGGLSYLHERLICKPAEGVLVWRHCADREQRWNTRFAGKEAFTTTSSEGYRQGRLDGRLYYAHRVIWAMHHGEWPEGHIDHINHRRDDNRIDNLRVVSQTENQRNQRKRKNLSGATGVFWDNRRSHWVASISTGGRKRHLGSFAERNEAIAARKSAERELGFHPNHGEACDLR